MADLLTQETLDKAHRLLDKLIDTTADAATEACNAGQDSTRDKLFMVQSHLLAAKSVAGGLNIGGIRPRSGGEK